MVVNFGGKQFFMDFVRFLIHEVLYAWRLRYICSAWFLVYIYIYIYIYIKTHGSESRPRKVELTHAQS